ncbi:hypothetical protein [Proteus hauseri]|nr:hypothetical protein [Proteus hauseri]
MASLNLLDSLVRIKSDYISIAKGINGTGQVILDGKVHFLDKGYFY